MADSLSAHSPVIDELAQTLGTKMSNCWQPDDTFFALIRSAGSDDVCGRS
jgi:hypothetical protein